MRVWIKRIGVICLIPIALVLLLSILLYIPPFQNFAVRKATEYAGKVTGMQIGIEQIRLSFPLDLTVKGVEVVNPPPGFYEPTDFEYERFTFNNRARVFWSQGFDPKWYLFPFPQTEINKGYGLVQNPGW